MLFYIDDIPAEDLVVEPSRNGEAIDLAPFEDATVTLTGPDGSVVDSSGFYVVLSDTAVLVEWPNESLLTEAGIYKLSVTLVGDTARERLAPVSVVVQAEDGWHNNDSAREEWITGAPEDEVMLANLLQVAKEQVIDFGEELEDGAPIPTRYRQGQLMQARNILNASKTDPGSVDGEFVLRPFPMDNVVKKIIRPDSALKEAF